MEIIVKVTHLDEFNDLVLDITKEAFADAGFEIGDSLDVSFSDGNCHKDVPLYDNFYGKPREIIVLSYYDNITIVPVSAAYIDLYPSEVGQFATITVNSKGKYKELAEIYHLPNPRHRNESQTDEQFGNYRMITVGNIKDNRIYRSGSPVDPKYNRTVIVSKFIEDNNIETVIDLAEDIEHVVEFTCKTAVVEELINNGCILCENMMPDYTCMQNRKQTADVIRNIGAYKTPFLIHCSLGQDRTGFVSALIDAVCGASYSEIVDDYMITYSNLYGFTKESDSKKYALMKERVDDMLIEITGNDDPSSLSNEELKTAAEKYLIELGLTYDEIEKAQSVLCG